VDNKKISVLLGLAAGAVIIAAFMMLRDFDAHRSSDFKAYSVAFESIVKGKNLVIQNLSVQLSRKEAENKDLRNTLSETRNALESLSKKIMMQPVSEEAPAGASAPAAAVPAPAAPAGVTK